jgi:poly(3-hydroxybutyrate) depolymerase
MHYFAYQAHSDVLKPVRSWAGIAGPMLAHARSAPLRNWRAACELLARARLTHERPAFGFKTVRVGNREVLVREEAVLATPFGTLLRFAKDMDAVQPRVLLVAPLSGHFATLLRATVETLLPEHDVHITDWHNARDVDPRHGRFGFDEYVEHLMNFLETMGPGAHVVAVCQPCVQTLAASAIMAEAGSAAVPRSMTLMAGPIDARVNPTRVNRLATGRPVRWFERNLIATVPSRYAGCGRRVYPGFVQLAAFMSMNIERHMKAHIDLFNHVARGEEEKARVTKAFYDEYLAVLDLPAEFYLETVQWVFQEYRLARGQLAWRGRPVDLRAIRRTAMLTVEAERDDICAVGQTLVAHELCTGLRPYLKRHHLQPGVGHYGVFSGKRWQNQVYPILRNLILASE